MKLDARGQLLVIVNRLPEETIGFLIGHVNHFIDLDDDKGHHTVITHDGMAHHPGSIIR